MSASVSLFRVVQRAELDDLTSLGTFRVGPNSVEGKYFWTTHEDAKWFARQLSSRYRERPSWIVEVLIDPATAAAMRQQDADQRPIRYLYEDQLEWFNEAVMELVLPTTAYRDASDV